jgi:hypothetical protein
MKTILIFFCAIFLTGCAAPDPYAQERERQRKASMTPAQLCMEDADKSNGWCTIGCGFYARNTLEQQQQQDCRVQCGQQKMLAYQMCSYK